MTCIRIAANTIACVQPWGRLKVGSRYVWLEFHPYCGPSFFTDSNMTRPYEPKDESDPVWPEFERWLKRFNAAKRKGEAKTA